MSPADLQALQNRDAVLGQFIVQALKRQDPAEYDSLVAYFAQNDAFTAALDQMNDALYGGVAP